MKRLTPSSIDVLGWKPTQSFNKSTLAKVFLTSPICIGLNSFIAFLHKEVSMASTNCKSWTGLLLPILKILCFANDFEGVGFKKSKLDFYNLNLMIVKDNLYFY